MRLAWHGLLGVSLLLAWAGPLAGTLHAHEGPPFPILVDEVDGPWSISVWADPDVGTGTFWIQIEATPGVDLPDDTRASVHVRPADGRLDETTWPAEPEAWDRGQQHVAKVEFPTREFWQVRIVLESESAAQTTERTLRVEVTPPGYGPLDLLLYLWPFLALAALWIKAIGKRRAAIRACAPAGLECGSEPGSDA